MSFFSKLIEKLTGSSASLQKIKDESDRRRASKSDAERPKVPADVEGKIASLLEKRIKSSESVKDPPKPKSK